MSDNSAISDDQLAAYLADELDDVAARRIDVALRSDPVLGRRLDDVHDALVEVRRPDEVQPPAELADRLAARLAQEPMRSEATATTRHRVAHPGRTATGVADHHLRRNRVRTIGTVAAAVVAVAVVGIGGGILGLGAGQDEGGDALTFSDPADMDTMQAPESDDSADDSAPMEESAEQDASVEMHTEDSEESADGEAHGDGLEDAPAPLDTDSEAWEELGEQALQCREQVEEAAGPVRPLSATEDEEQGRAVLIYELASRDRIVTVTVDARTCGVLRSEVDR